MEILYTTEHVLEYWGFIVLAVMLLLLFGSLMFVGLFNLIKEKDYSEDLGATIICAIFSSVLVASLIMLINQDVRVTSDVKVTDWNEVYEQGYEVVKQKGDIVTVELK